MTKSTFVTILALAAAAATACGGSMPSAPSAPSVPDPSSAAAPPTTAAAAPSVGGDKDGDGIPDNVDKCPDKKEDGLPPDPKDGCPKS